MRWAFAALWASVIFATSSTVVSRPAFVNAVAGVLPGAATRGVWTWFWYSCGLLVVKGYHAAEFALLFLLIRWALVRVGPVRATRTAIAVCVFFAAADEWHQTFVPGRGGVWTDVAIDVGGVLLAASLTSRDPSGRLPRGFPPPPCPTSRGSG